ncbi:MAG: YlbF family regulator [Sedimentisphaerales bacterium]|nr:YlbF family regulator [Sedimentisphaerales bacterium]
MESLIEMARRLGKHIAADDRTVQLKKARQVVDADSTAADLVNRYHEQISKIQRLEQEGKPVEVADKKVLQELETQISTHAALKELSRRQVDFVDLMRKIKQAIDNELQLEDL